jgi:Baseplate J-like protein
MPLPLPNLDDRNFNQLVEDARRIILQRAPSWTDLSASDPGMTLLEIFAYLTETMIYRLNLLPRKAYIAFLSLLGVSVHPPSAAGVTLRFSRARPGDQPIQIPRGTRATLGRTDGGSEPPIFVTASTVTIAADQASVEVTAYNAEQIDAELADQKGTGLPGLYVTVRRPPIVAPTGDGLDLIVGVEAAPGELDERAPAIQYNGKAYRIWREVENFSNLGPDPFVYVADRTTGTITFAPAAFMQTRTGVLDETARALAAIPTVGREIRVWYRRGGGPAGNVPASTITVLKDPITGVQVTNPQPATGGRAAETLENALIRGPQELHSLQRAVTAQDFEAIAMSSSQAIDRTRALTKAALWTYAAPGTVEVLLVPDLPEEMRGTAQVTAAALHEHETTEAYDQIQQALDERRPLGTSCQVTWTRYKPVRVTARVVVRREEDLLAVRQRVIERLYQTISPVRTKFNTNGWQFGQALRASHVYDMALAEPGLRWVDHVGLIVDQVPNTTVTSIAADPTQPQTWYAGSNTTLFRSLNNGEGWEGMISFPNEPIDLIRAHPDHPGLVGVCTRLPNDGGSRLHVSWDCGESWQTAADLQALRVEGLAWTMRDTIPVLLMATVKGLYELELRPGGGPVQVNVDPAAQDLGFYAVAASKAVRGVMNVAVAAQNRRGVYLSKDGGQHFQQIGLTGEDIRELAVQYDGNRSFLWAGTFTSGGDDPGKGCFRWELIFLGDPPDRWQSFGSGWTGGSCKAIAFLGKKILAASHRSGVMWLEPERDPTWHAPAVTCGLPLRDPGRFQPVDTVDAVMGDPAARPPKVPVLMAGGVQGVFRSVDEGLAYNETSNSVFTERVTLPQTWLFVSGEHNIEVVSEDEANRN